MTDAEKLESLAFRLKDLESIRRLFAELNFEFVDQPVYKKDWSDELKDIAIESRIIAKKHDFLICYIKIERESIKDWKQVATKIISANNGFCLVCSHDPNGFQWIFSSLSKEYSKSFSESRHIPIEIKPNLGVPKPFLEFLESIAVEDSDNGLTILGKISKAFDKFSLQIHDELTVNVFKAFKTLSEGIISDKNNDFELNSEALKKTRSPIFILLYRIIFVLYAEDRLIFPIDNKIYKKEFSLRWIKLNWLLKPETISKLNEYEVQNRLKKLFHLIEVGSDALEYTSNEFFMMSYYGRLFDRKIHADIEKWKIPNKYLLDALRFITGTKDKKGNFFFLDYSALETRHLGSIYEHLLEYHLTIKNKKISELPDPKDRRISASYYTPDYIVNYIVSKNIEPLISEIVANNPDKNTQLEKILSLKILDPAMGSGHFLIGAVNYLAKRICEIEYGEVREKELTEKKREVVRLCIYGVDLNPLAVDLAKLALWLETLSIDKPLSFLQGHLKNGNSLVGSNISSVFDAQQSLFETKTVSHLKKTVKEFLAFETLSDDTASTVKAKIEKYDKMQRKGTTIHQLRGLLDHKLAEEFGIEVSPWRDLRQKVGVESLDFYASESGTSIKEIRDKENFFHWELEFPQVFFNHNGERKKDAGFDIIIGNPPYIGIKGVHISSKLTPKFLKKEYESATGRYDHYIIFVEKCSQILKKSGRLGFILPHKFTNAEFGIGLRNYLSKNKLIEELLSFGHNFVFKDSTTYTCILIISKKINDSFQFYEIKDVERKIEDEIKNIEKKFTKIFIEKLDNNAWILSDKKTLKIIEKMKNSGSDILTYFDKILSGAQTGDNDIYIVTPKKINKKTITVFSNKLNKTVELEKEMLKPLLIGADIKKYKTLERSNQYLVYPYFIFRFL